MPTQSLANILDPIHDTLDPSVFDDPGSDTPVLKEQHRKWIIREIIKTLEDHGYTHINDWLSLVLTGSLTTYQYSEDSDVDVSLFVDSKHFPEWSRAEMIGIMVGNIDGTKLPGTTHPMQCFVVPPLVTKESLYSPGLRSGYDLLKKEWVQPPERDRAYNVEQEQNADYVYALECADKMERLLRYEPDKAVDYWHQIHERRRRDQKKGKGDFAQSNIVYKFLANRGLFDDISQASGEYIAKTAAGEVSKFIYDPIDNKLVVGEMGAEEGEVASHSGLAQFANINLNNKPLWGQVSSSGYIQTFGRPNLDGYGQGKDPKINPYEAYWKLSQALKEPYPAAKWTKPPELLNQSWADNYVAPEVIYAGEPPVVDAPTGFAQDETVFA